MTFQSVQLFKFIGRNTYWLYICLGFRHKVTMALLHTIKPILFVLLVLWACSIEAGERWAGEVVGISDGETIKVMRGGHQVKIRLYGIDCPEKGQAFRRRAKKFTSDLVFRKVVQIDAVDTDRYGRTIAWVYVRGRNVNVELVRAGLAWHYKRYSTDRILVYAELEARGKRLGLWQERKPVASWEFRRLKRKKK